MKQITPNLPHKFIERNSESVVCDFCLKPRRHEIHVVNEMSLSRRVRLQVLDEAIQICNEAIEDTKYAIKFIEEEDVKSFYLEGCLKEAERLCEAIKKLKENP